MNENATKTIKNANRAVLKSNKEASKNCFNTATARQQQWPYTDMGRARVGNNNCYIANRLNRGKLNRKTRMEMPEVE